jgi:hypothetical protein
MNYEKTAKAEIAKRATFLGIVAWVSTCLIAVGMFPTIATEFSGLFMLNGLFGLAASVGLHEVVKRDKLACDGQET